MQNDNNRQMGDKAKKPSDQQQNQQGSGQGGQKRGGSYAEKIEREGERKGDHQQGGKDNEQSRHTDKGQGL